jgi:hypothetical protein
MARWMDRLQERLVEAGGLPWRLRHPRGGALVAPELGGRLLAVELDGRSCLWFHPDLIETGRAPDWNAGGQRTWIAPEHAPQSLFETGGSWRCPPSLDPGRFREAAAAGPDEVCLESAFTASPRGRPIRFRVWRRIQLERGDAALTLRVDQAVAYEGAPGEDAAFGAWAILQVPAPGIARVELVPGVTRREAAGPAGKPFHDDFFEPVPADGWTATETNAVLRMTGDRPYKAGFAADRLPPLSRLDYFFGPAGARRTLRITQEIDVPPDGLFAEVPGGVPARGGDAVQLYNHSAGGRLGYAELEGHGSAGPPGSGVSVLSVRYEFDWLSRREMQRFLQDRGLNGLDRL